VRVSIAMTTYNGERYIIEQLESLLMQTCKADEVVIVDDCSTDLTPNIVNEFILIHSLANWKFLVRSENQGYVRTFREALSLTTGDVIFLCDQDDVWVIDKIKVMKEEMISNKKICMLSCSDIMVDEHLKQLSIKKKLIANKYITKHVKGSVRRIHGACIRLNDFSGAIGCLCAITRSLCDKYLQMPIYTTAHDYALARLAELQGGYYFVNIPLVYYRRHSSNITNPNQKESEIACRIYGMEIELKDFKDLPIIFNCKQIINKYFIRRKHYLELRYSFLNQRDYKAFLLYTLYSIRRPWKLKTHLRLASDLFFVLKERLSG